MYDYNITIHNTAAVDTAAGMQGLNGIG